VTDDHVSAGSAGGGAAAVEVVGGPAGQAAELGGRAVHGADLLDLEEQLLVRRCQQRLAGRRDVGGQRQFASLQVLSAQVGGGGHRCRHDGVPD